MIFPKVVFGTDPEYFIVADEGKTLIPAEFLVSTDHSPHARFYADNVAIEFPVRAYSDTQKVIADLHNRIIEFSRRVVDGVKLLAHAAVDFPSETLKQTFVGRAFGCEPAEIVENGQQKTYRVSLPDTFTKRSAGFHVHLGIELVGNAKTKQEIIVQSVMNADVLAGLFGVVVDSRNREANLVRRQEVGYGRAGEFRNQPHGFEYRTLPASIGKSAILMEAAFLLVQDAYISAINGLRFQEHVSMTEVARAINEMDEVSARTLFDEAMKHLNTHSVDDRKSLFDDHVFRKKIIKYMNGTINDFNLDVTPELSSSVVAL